MNDLLLQLIFYAFAGLAIISAFLVVTQNNPVRCVLFLVLTFFASSVLWILLQAEFLALILVLVYVGAVMTLFLFVVMMLNIDIESQRRKFMRYLPFGLLLVALLTALLLTSIPADTFKTGVEVSGVAQQIVHESLIPEGVPAPKAISNTLALGLILYTDYFMAFELAAAILLVAIVAAITLVHRKPRGSKQQNVMKQIMVTKESRLQLKKMKPME